MKTVAWGLVVLLLSASIGFAWQRCSNDSQPPTGTGTKANAEAEMSPLGPIPETAEVVRHPVDIESKPPEKLSSIIKRSVLKDLGRRLGDKLLPSQVSSLVDTVSEDALVKAREDSLLQAALFTHLVPDEDRGSLAYRKRFSSALADLRRQRKTLLASRDSLTGSYVDLVVRGEAPRGRRNRVAGALGGFVASTGSSVTGWVEVPSSHEAYAVQDEIDAWRMSAIEFLSRLHL